MLFFPSQARTLGSAVSAALLAGSDKHRSRTARGHETRQVGRQVARSHGGRWSGRFVDFLGAHDST